MLAYDRTIAENSRETMNLAKAFEEHVGEIVADVDKDLLNLKKSYWNKNYNTPIFMIV